MHLLSILIPLDGQKVRKEDHGMKRKHGRKIKPVTVIMPFLCIFSIITIGIIIIICMTLAGASKEMPNETETRDNDSAADQIILAKQDTITYEDDHYIPSTVKLPVRAICQYPELPTGCEATATVMALNYLGAGVYLEPFADFLPRQAVIDTGNGLSGPDPNVSFAGDPHKDIGSFGCFEPVIIQTVNDNFPAYYAQKVNGSIDELCSYIDMGYPVIIWTTMELQEIRRVTTWTLPDGSSFTWPGNEHCMLLVGYDDSYYYFNDPRNGECVAYDKDLSELRFEEMGSRAVMITPAQ